MSTLRQPLDLVHRAGSDAGGGARRWLSGVLAGAALVAAITAVIALLEPHVPVLSLAVLYLFAVLPLAVFWGLTLAVAVSVASMLAFNFYFLPPTHTFTLQDSRNWFALAVFVVTSLVVSGLAARSRRRATEAALVLREVAEDVESRRQPALLEPLSKQAVAERILALVEPQPKSQRILRRAWRSSQRLGAEIDAIWVRPERYEPTPEEATQLSALHRLAGILGIHFLEVDGDDLVETVRGVAGERGSTYIFIGTPDERRRVEILRGSLLSRMVRELPGLDIRVVADRALREAE
jgi:K+-sensing histidine kinase KdpD